MMLVATPGSFAFFFFYSVAQPAARGKPHFDAVGGTATQLGKNWPESGFQHSKKHGMREHEYKDGKGRK